MASKLTDQIVDKRLVERNIRKGLITRKAADKHVADTKDVEANAESVPYYDPEPEEVEGGGDTIIDELAPGAPVAPTASEAAPAPVATEEA